VIEFKREVYAQALCELSRYLPGVRMRRPDLERVGLPPQPGEVSLP
jgi:hypothetical protein